MLLHQYVYHCLNFLFNNYCNPLYLYLVDEINNFGIQMKKVVFSVIGAVVISFFVFLYLGSVFTNKYYSENYEKLKISQSDHSSEFDSTFHKQLPKQLLRYLDANVKDLKRFPSIVETKITSQFKTDKSSNYLPFTIKQFYSTTYPGYLLDGQIQTNDLISIRSLESFINGKGNLLNKFLSSVTISDAQGSQIDQNGITRYLVESVLYPSVFYNYNGFTFNEIDSSTVEISIQLDTLNSTAEFHFNDKNEITKIITNSKFRTTKLGYTKHLHETRFKNYQFFGNYKLPTQIEHSWVSEDTHFTYQKIQVNNIQYYY